MSDAFARRTLGPPVGGTTDTNKGALIADAQTPALEFVDSSGNTHGVETTTLLLQAQTALTTITTAQNLFTLAFLAGALNKTNRALRISGTVIFTTAGTPTITLSIKLGTVTLVAILTPAIGNAQTNGQMAFEFIVSVATAGSSGTLETHGELTVQGGSALSAGVVQYLDQNTAVSSAVNLTSALTLAVTLAASTTVSSAQLRQGLIEVIN
jgi:phage baseplate assembly protein gpV